METVNNSNTSGTPVKKPVFYIEYEKKDITAYISPYVLSVSYTDNEHGQSDEIDIQIEDKDHKWKSSWYPTKGDLLTLKIGFEGDKLINCGGFEIDEIEISGPPDTINIKGLAANIKKALRQNNSAAYENKTLKQIAEDIAKKHGYTLVGSVKDIKVQRITQNKERDLSFLKRLAESYGYVFKIADNQLVFYEVEKLETSDVIYVVDRKDMLSFNFKDKTNGVYKSCEVSYFDPKTKKLITHTESLKNVKEGDTLKLNVRCENKQQAIQKAKAGLAGRVKELEGNMTISGVPKLSGGVNVEITGLYKISGKYHIKTAKHTIDRSSGYKTELEIYKVDA